jgi:transcriptional regulator
MYNLPYFKDRNGDAVLQFMRDNAFAILCGADANGTPVATQLPLLIEEREGVLYLQGHLMRQTDHHLAWLDNPNVLCVFTGAHAYVSATWYSDPNQASTWNYQTVQARGRMRFTSEEELITIMQKTTLHYEGGDAASTTIYDNLPPAYRERLLKAIAGVEIRVDSLEHVFKLSQNRDQQSYRTIMERLMQTDAAGIAVAKAMQEREADLFGKV